MLRLRPRRQVLKTSCCIDAKFTEIQVKDGRLKEFAWRMRALDMI